MPYVNEQIAIENRFYALFNAAYPTIAIMFENREFKRPDQTKSYIGVFVKSGPGRRIELGPGPTYRREGFIQFNIYTPPRNGKKLALTYADAIDQYFVDAEFAAGTDGIVRSYASTPRPVGNRDGHYVFILNYPYKYDNKGGPVGSVFHAIVGTVDGVNTVFTLPGNPNPATAQIFLDGLLQTLGTSYTYDGVTLTMATPPQVGDDFVAFY
jgi:hypothetical protein